MSKKSTVILFYIIITIYALLLSFLMLKNGLYRGHDLVFHLSRIIGLKDSLINGDIIALIHVGLYGYGYANGLFYGNLFIYLPAILHMQGLSIVRSYAVFLCLINIFTGFTIYYALNKIIKKPTISLVGSIIYLSIPYRIYDYTIRAAVGEMLAFAIVPIILLGIIEIIYNDGKKWWLLSIGFVLLIQSHIISTILLFITCIILLIINYKYITKNVIISLIKAATLGILLGAFFIFPLLEQYIYSSLVINNLNTEKEIIKHTLPVEKLFLGIICFKNNNYYIPGVGLLFVVISLLRFKIKTKNKKLLKICDSLLIIGFGSLICITDFFPWAELGRYLGFIQFPWRLYLISTVCLLFSSSIILYLYEKMNKKKYIIIIIISIISAMTNIYISKNVLDDYWGYEEAIYIKSYEVNYYVAGGEYLPYKTNIDALNKRGDIITSNNENLKIDFNRKGNKLYINYSNNTNKDTYIDLPLLNYRGYKADKGYIIRNGNNNIIRINLNKESDSFKVYYGGTLIQKISYIISVVTLITMIIYIIIKKEKGHEKK